MLRTLLNLLFVSILFVPTPGSAKENIPDDIRYMLEDMYGANKNKWPSTRHKADINADGFTDWVIQKKSCSQDENCAAEIFICIPDKKGLCSEYCYIEVKTLNNVEELLKIKKCESTC